MNRIGRTLVLAVAPLLAMGAGAEVTQDCIVEGTVDKHKAQRAGKDVYVAFHSAREATRGVDCTINRRRHRVEFKEPTDSGLEDAPHGSTVRYRYTEEDNEKGEWELLDISSS